jgi:hypothetical protein
MREPCNIDFKLMIDLPPDLEGFASFLDAQPSPVREAFQYCLCLMMVEAGKMRLVETLPGETASIAVFESAAVERFSVARPSITEQQEAELVGVLRELLADDGYI